MDSVVELSLWIRVRLLFCSTNLSLYFRLHHFASVSLTDRVIVFGSTASSNSRNVAQYKQDIWSVLGQFYCLIFNILLFFKRSTGQSSSCIWCSLQSRNGHDCWRSWLSVSNILYFNLLNL